MRPARPHCGQEGGNRRFPPSCQSPTFPLGRAARARVSDAFRLPPACCCDRHGMGCHPRGCFCTGNGTASPYIKKRYGISIAFLLFVRKHLDVKCFTDLKKQIKGRGFPPALNLIDIGLCPIHHFPQLGLSQSLFLTAFFEKRAIINHALPLPTGFVGRGDLGAPPSS